MYLAENVWTSCQVVAYKAVSVKVWTIVDSLYKSLQQNWETGEK